MGKRALWGWILVVALSGLWKMTAGFAEEPAAQKPVGEAPVVQQPAAAIPDEEDLEYTFGTVKSVGTDQIVIMEFDYDSGQEKEMTYALDPKVQLNNAASLQEIKQGDEVDIDYRVQDDRKIAVVISVAKPLPGEPAEEQ